MEKEMTDEIDRFDFKYTGWDEADMVRDDDGEYVRHADHLAAMQDGDARIAELEADLAAEVENNAAEFADRTEAQRSNRQLRADNERLHNELNASKSYYPDGVKFGPHPERDKHALALFAAWVGMPVDRLPSEMRGHTCAATMKAWGRVARASEAYLQRKTGE